MKIKKTKINGYDVYLYKTKKYSTIAMRFLFENDYTREFIYKSDLLEEYMIHSTKKYKTRKELNKKIMELYSVQYNINNYNLGEKLFTAATFCFADPALVKDNYLKEALEFAHEILFHPNFEDGLLDKVELDRSRDNLINSVGERLLENGTRSSNSYVKVAFPNTYETIDLIEKKEDYVSLIESFTDADLIEAHDSLINKSLVGLVIMGNIEDEYLKYIEEIFKFPSVKELDKDYREYISIDTTTPFYTKVTDEDYKESILRVAYHCPATTRREELIYLMIALMLGSSGMLIHKVLRDEMKLVYRAGCSYNRYLQSLTLRAFLDKDNESIAIEGFDKVISLLKNKSLVEELLGKIKEENSLALYTFDENKWNPFYELYDLAFDFDISEEEKTEIMDSVTVDDIMTALDKMEKVKIHFYEGGRE